MDRRIAGDSRQSDLEAVTEKVAAAAARVLQDPRAKYPKPPFPGQSQPWPGVEALSISDFREGNIILELQVVTGPKFEEVGLSSGDVRATLVVLFPGPHPAAVRKYHDEYEDFLAEKTKRLQEGPARLVVLDPSYGADLVAYCSAADLIGVG